MTTPVKFVAPLAGVSAADVGALPVAARGAAGGVAPLDSGLLVPIAYLPVGTGAGTVAAGDDARLSDARTPLAHTHAQANVTGLTTDLAARQLVAEKGQPNGYAGLDSGGKLDGTAQVYATLASSILPVGNAAAVGTFNSAARSNHTHAGVALTGDQTVAGVKTFTSSPLVPEPTTGSQAVTKTYADTKVAASSAGAAGGVATLDSGTKVPVAQLPVGTVAGTVAAGDDSRLSNARTPTAHASSHAAGGSDPLTLASVLGGAPAAGDVVAYSGGVWTASTRLTTAESAITTLQLLVSPQPTDTMLYGDVLGSVQRSRATNSTSLSNGYYTLSMILCSKSVTVTKVRFYVSGAGVASTGTAVSLNLYAGTPATALPRVATVPSLTQATFTSTGVKELALSSSVTLAAGDRLAWMTYIPASAYSTSPGVACTAVTYGPLINAGTVWSGYQAAAVAAPATINSTTGWTTDVTWIWWALL